MISFESFSEAGGHPVNEDAFEVRRHPAEPDCWICSLADGQGGSAGGEVAARLASRIAAEEAIRHPPRTLGEPSAWEEILRQADRAVFSAPEAGFTTLLGFCILDGRLAGASSGDSAILVASGNGAATEATRGQFKNPPVGSGSARLVPFSCSLVRPWTILAMSDGVWKYVGWDRLLLAVKSPRVAPLVETLPRAARLPRSDQFPDDFTLVVFEDTA